MVKDGWAIGGREARVVSSKTRYTRRYDQTTSAEWWRLAGPTVGARPKGVCTEARCARRLNWTAGAELPQTVRRRVADVLCEAVGDAVPPKEVESCRAGAARTWFFEAVEHCEDVGRLEAEGAPEAEVRCEDVGGAKPPRRRQAETGGRREVQSDAGPRRSMKTWHAVRPESPGAGRDVVELREAVGRNVAVGRGEADVLREAAGSARSLSVASMWSDTWPGGATGSWSAAMLMCCMVK